MLVLYLTELEGKTVLGKKVSPAWQRILNLGKVGVTLIHSVAFLKDIGVCRQ